MESSRSHTAGNALSSARAVRLGVLLAGITCASAVTTPTADAQSPTPRPEQRVALVTGSTSGLGRELALRLGSMGMRVIVHGRNRERGMEVVEAIEREGVGNARFYAADLASLAQVHEFGEAVLSDYDRLDLLVNNAGIGPSPDGRLLSEDGHELLFQVNHLSHFLLTRLLLPRLLENAPSRIVNVTSSAQGPIDFDDVMMENNFTTWRAYRQSKLAQVMFTFDLAAELDGTDVIVNTVDPANNMPTPMVRRAGVTVKATIAEGADAVMQLVTSPDIGSGRYFSELLPGTANDQAYDEEARAKLWQLSEELTGARRPG